MNLGLLLMLNLRMKAICKLGILGALSECLCGKSDVACNAIQASRFTFVTLDHAAAWEFK